MELFSRGLDAAAPTSAVVWHTLDLVADMLAARSPAAGAASDSTESHMVPRDHLGQLVTKAEAKTRAFLSRSERVKTRGTGTVKPTLHGDGVDIGSSSKDAEAQRLRKAYERVLDRAPEWRIKFPNLKGGADRLGSSLASMAPKAQRNTAKRREDPNAHGSGVGVGDASPTRKRART